MTYDISALEIYLLTNDDRAFTTENHHVDIGSFFVLAVTYALYRTLFLFNINFVYDLIVVNEELLLSAKMFYYKCCFLHMHFMLISS